MIRALAIVTALAASSSADTYRFERGARVEHDHACKAAPGVIDAWVAQSKITLGHDQATLAVKNVSYGADTHAPPYDAFTIDENTHVQVKIDGLECSDIHCKELVATYTVIRWRDGAPVCYEQWLGTATPIK